MEEKIWAIPTASETAPPVRPVTFFSDFRLEPGRSEAVKPMYFSNRQKNGQVYQQEH